jgi:serine/threonine protein kinase
MNYMTIAGSDDYMAPEVLLGEKYDEKCDVFGFGVLLGGTASAAFNWLRRIAVAMVN